MWLRPLVEAYPEQCPSGFFLVDALLEMDRRFDGKLLVLPPVNGRMVDTPNDQKLEMATTEVKKLKKLYSALRYLYRNGFSAVTLQVF